MRIVKCNSLRMWDRAILLYEKQKWGMGGFPVRVASPEGIPMFQFVEMLDIYILLLFGGESSLRVCWKILNRKKDGEVHGLRCFGAIWVDVIRICLDEMMRDDSGL